MSNYFDNKDSFLAPKVNQYSNHMVMTNVSLPTQVKYINIDTRNLDTSCNPIASYVVNLPDRINNVKSLSLRNIEIPNTFYNISSNLGNNYFSVYDIANDIGGNVVIPDGNYTTTTLVTQINSSLYSLGYNFSDLTFSVTNNFFNVTLAGGSDATSGINIIFDYDKDGNFDKYNFKRKLGWILGFRGLSYTITDTTLVAESLPDLNGPRYLYLVVDEFSKGNQNSFIAPISKSILQSNILARITMDPVAFSFGNIIPANIYNGLLLNDKRKYNGKVDLQKLKIVLTDENGIPVNLNGLGFSFCMEVEYE